MFGFSFTTIAVAAGLALASAVGIYWLGYSGGKQDGREEMLAASIEAYENRQEIDDEVGTADRASICVELGGLRHECLKLRGLDEAAPAE